MPSFPGASAQRRGAQKEGGDEALGQSRGGLSPMIHATVDAPGNPVGFTLTGSEAADLPGAVASFH